MTNPVRRGRRFPVSWPVQYRRPGDHDWLAGRTVNMSISGVLFVAQTLPPPHETLELAILIEAPDHRVTSSLVGTMGRVVRTEPTVPGAVAVEFAAPGLHGLAALDASRT